MRFRHVYMGLFGVLVFLVLILSDPDLGIVQNLPFGSSTVSILIILLYSVFYVAMLHLSRKALVDYIDLEQYFQMALRTPEGAGKAIIGVGLIMVSIAIVIFAATNN